LGQHAAESPYNFAKKNGRSFLTIADFDLFFFVHSLQGLKA